MNDFVECPTCVSKPGAQNLCASCLVNRAAISELNEMVRQIARERDDMKEAVQLMYKALGLLFKGG